MEQMIPRPEYPRPQFVRDTWMNLNGSWMFEIDCGDSGEARGLAEAPTLSGTINVPFCPESRLSGVEHKDFMEAVWYKRTFTLPESAENQRVLLHFGAVDYLCTAWLNGKHVGTHTGGYSSFTFDITSALQPGENLLTVRAQDYLRRNMQPFGKQCSVFNSAGCSYTRTTGIWQTVWLEWTNPVSIDSVRMYPDAENGILNLQAVLHGCAAGCLIHAEAFFEGEYQGSAEGYACGDRAYLTLKVKDKHLWTAGQGNLYDLKLTLSRGSEILDKADSYFALRNVSIDGKKFLINGKPVFQRLILDQGFFPDGVYTAPTDSELKADIERSMAMGFNGARLHQRVFEQRYLYWADKLGYLCWGEMASWGIDTYQLEALPIFQSEWLEIVERDFNAPCIIGWCPFNETWRPKDKSIHSNTIKNIYKATKGLDVTRPVLDSSGGMHTWYTDVFDVHDYNQDPAVLESRVGKGRKLHDAFEKEHVPYDGKKPVFVSEYGGIRWSSGSAGWGYGTAPQSEEEFIARYKGLTEVLLDNPEHFGFCYTQLTDVEQEQNGLYTYERVPKFDPKIIHDITARKAAYEEEE